MNLLNTLVLVCLFEMWFPHPRQPVLHILQSTSHKLSIIHYHYHTATAGGSFGTGYFTQAALWDMRGKLLNYWRYLFGLSKAFRVVSLDFRL